MTNQPKVLCKNCIYQKPREPSYLGAFTCTIILPFGFKRSDRNEVVTVFGCDLGVENNS